MDAYYTRQAVLPHFTGYSRQRGSGIGSLAAGVGRVALPFAKKFLLPAVKSIGKDLIANTLPELVEVVSKKKSPKQAAKSAIRKTIKKQIGGRKKRRVIKRKRKSARSRSNFFHRICSYCITAFDNSDSLYNHQEEVHGLPRPMRAEKNSLKKPTTTAINGSLKVYTILGNEEEDLFEFMMDKKSEINSIILLNTVRNSPKVQLCATID